MPVTVRKAAAWAIVFSGAAFALPQPILAQTLTSAEPSLSGTVTSSAEGAMEGVLVSAKKPDTNITVTVVTDAQGRYRFPAAKLAPGHYDISIRAIGYDLDGPAAADAAAGGVTADLRLKPTADISLQLTNAEWIASFPGTPQQKNTMLNCVNCHTLSRITHSEHTADEFLTVTLPRMQGYVNQSIPAAPQLRKAERLMEERGDQRVQIYKALGDFLSSINLSASKEWKYDLKTFPRPKGRATQVIYTEYDLPRETIQPHDVVIDSDGIAWYSSFGEQFIGRLDPKTGAHREFPIPMSKPDFQTGTLALRQDRDGNLWLGNMYQGALVRFDRKSETLKLYSLPPEINIDQAQVNMASPQSSHIDGKVWAQNNGFAGVHRFDIASGKVETWEPYKGIPGSHNIYDVIPDSQNNVYFTDFRQRHIGRIDAKTGDLQLFATRTEGSNPRRGQMDAKDRLWFGEYRGNRIGMFDTKTEQFKEWQVPTPFSAPYDVTLDKNDNAWTGSMSSDRVARLDTNTGEFVEYLLPRSTNIRRVFVDNTTTQPTFWVGSNHGASIVKLEPLD